MEAYLDNAATTRVSEAAAAKALEAMTDHFGNPSSLHHKGVEAEQYIRGTRETVSRILRVQPEQIVFTSGGTEANNAAVFGTAAAHVHEGRHIITTPFEHDSVNEPLAALEKEGWEVTRLPVDSRGLVDPQALREALREDTVLVSVMYVNNEIGSVQHIDELAAAVHEGSRALFHTDAVQAFGKLDIRPAKQGIDLLSASGHKIHAPKGTGLLYVGPRARIRPFILGGGQQKGRRSGTENVPGIAGLGAAAAEMYAAMDEHTERFRKLQRILIEGVRDIGGVTVNGPAAGMDADGAFPAEAAPHIVSLSFEGVRAEVLLHALEDRGVYVSSGSACSSNHAARTHSRTLVSTGLDPGLLESTLRFSFGAMTTEEEAALAVSALQELIPFLRRFTRD